MAKRRDDLRAEAAANDVVRGLFMMWHGLFELGLTTSPGTGEPNALDDEIAGLKARIFRRVRNSVTADIRNGIRELRED